MTQEEQRLKDEADYKAYINNQKEESEYNEYLKYSSSSIPKDIKKESFSDQLKRLESDYGPNYDLGQEMISRAADLPSGLARVGVAGLSDLATMGNTNFYRSGDLEKALTGQAPRDIVKRGGGASETDILYNLLSDTLGPSIVSKVAASIGNVFKKPQGKITSDQLAEINKQEIKYPESNQKPIEDISDFDIRSKEQRDLLNKAREDLRVRGTTNKEKELQDLLKGSGGVVVPIEKIQSLGIPRINEIISETNMSRGLKPEKYYARSGQQMQAPLYETNRSSSSIPPVTTYEQAADQLYLPLPTPVKTEQSIWKMLSEPSAKQEVIKPTGEFSSINRVSQQSLPLETVIKTPIEQPMYTPIELRDWPSLNIGTKMPPGYAEIPAKTALQLNRVIRKAGVRYDKGAPIGEFGKVLNPSELSDLSSELTKAVRSKDPAIAKVLDEQGFGKDIQKALRLGAKNPEAFLNPKTAKGKETLSATQKLIGGNDLLAMREKLIREKMAASEENALLQEMKKMRAESAAAREAEKSKVKNAVKTIVELIPGGKRLIGAKEAASAAKDLIGSSKFPEAYTSDQISNPSPFWINAFTTKERK